MHTKGHFCWSFISWAAIAGLMFGLWGCSPPATPTSVPTPPAASETPVPPSPTATATATSLPYPSLQEGNDLRLAALAPRPSSELADNRIGVHFEDFERYSNTPFVLGLGFKRVRIQSLTDFWADNRMDLKVFTLDSIPQAVEDKIDEYAANGVKVVLDLWMGAGLVPYGTSFRTQQELDQFAQYVEYVVSHFKGRIPYYTIWNEPGDMTPDAYANLVRTVVPVIREQDPQAKIIIGAMHGDWVNGYPGYGPYQRYSLADEYLKAVIRSGVAPSVDGISWHPFYDNVPTDPYYQDYPALVGDIKELAASEGFSGEYFADEILWRTVTEEDFSGGPPVEPMIAAKYYTRAITMHRGLDISVTINTFFIEPEREWVTVDALAPIHNLADTLSGAEPADVTFSMEGAPENTLTYAFSMPDGATLIAVWTNGEAVLDDPGTSVGLTIPGAAGRKASGIDVLQGFEQELVSGEAGDALTINGLQVKDYPIIIRLAD